MTTTQSSLAVEEALRLWDTWRTRRAETPAAERVGDVDAFLSISRVVGAGGGQVARAVGARLRWPVFDKDMLAEMAESLRGRLYETMGESDLDWMEEQLEKLAADVPARENTFRRLAETLLGLARQGHAVFLGRAADLILPRRCGFRVRMAAPREYCVHQYARWHQTTGAEARRIFEQMECERDRFIRAHFSIDPNEPGRHDLVLNLERFTTDQAVEVILASMRARRVIGAAEGA